MINKGQSLFCGIENILQKMHNSVKQKKGDSFRVLIALKKKLGQGKDPTWSTLS